MFKFPFLYMFSDNKFLKKYLTIFIFIFLFLYSDGILESNHYTFDNYYLSTVLLSIIVFLLQAVIIGYNITNVSALNIENKVQPLPLLNLRRDFIKGFKFQIAILIFSGFATCFIGGLGLLAGLSIVIANNVICSSLMILTIISLISYLLYGLLFAPGFVNIYAKHPSYLIFFKIKLLVTSIKQAPKKYSLSTLFYLIIILLLLGIFNFIVNNSNVIIFILTVTITSLLMTYLFFVNSYIIANCLENNK